MSRYIRSPKKVVKEVNECIAKITEEINYIPNRAPGMSLNAQGYTPGILIPSFQNQFSAGIPAEIESVISVHNYQAIIVNYNYDRDSEEESVINLLFYNIDGIIPSEKYHTIRTMEFLRLVTILVVELMDVQGERLDMEVGFDGRQTTFDIVCVVLNKRVRCKILYLDSKGGTRNEQRYQGYCNTMMLHNLSPLRMNPRAISSIRLGMQLMCDAPSTNPDLNGIFCINNDTAMGALLLCCERDFAVLEQISTAGLHELETGRQAIPGPASVITPRFGIGRMAAQVLLSKIKSDDHNRNTVDLGHQIYHGGTLQVIFPALYIFSLPDAVYTPGRKLEEIS